MKRDAISYVDYIDDATWQPLVGALLDSDRVEILKDTARAQYASGHLLFTRGTTLMAQAFDQQRSSSQHASRTVVAEEIIRQPADLTRASRASSGSPK